MAEPRAVSTVMLKGGTTKSTITANTAEALGRKGNDVLAIDTDPNGHLSLNLGFDDLYRDSEVDIGDVILSSGNATPNDIIRETGLGFDLIPSSNALETIEANLDGELQPSLCLKNELVDPLLGDAYDYILIDTHSSRNKLVNNAVVAAPNLLLPTPPEQGVQNGLQQTRERIIDPLRERLGLQVLALVPNKLSQRIDYQTGDRQLIERLVTNDALAPLVPNFAYISPEDLEAIDANQYEGALPKPGIREDVDIDNAFNDDQTLGAYNPESDQLACFDELAEIVVEGGVTRDD